MRSISHTPETATFPRRLSSAALVTLFVLGLAGAIPARAATPPGTVNYQGVLRDNLDRPFNATTVEMTFRFVDAPEAGSEIMLDQHTIAAGNAILVSNGLFNVGLGTGTVADGSGPGTFTSLDAVFRDYGTVWLEVVINGETLSPRTQIQSAPYALNSAGLGGHPDDYFINTSSTPQEKSGQLTLGQSDPSFYALDAEAYWTSIYAYSQVGHAVLAESAGANPAGYFRGGATGVGVYGTAQNGVVGTGSSAGVVGNGGTAGGRFYASNTTTEVATSIYGIHTTGSASGGLSVGVLASGFDKGMEGYGNNFGGYFRGNSLHGVYASGPDHGVDGDGGNYGGYFEASNADSYGVAAFGVHTGVFGQGQTRGGWFKNTGSGSYGEIGVGSYKILGNGAVSFAQNHPTDLSKVIVYVAPEGDEAAVYTRGSGRLVNGEARVPLGETFALVTNPDIGLTATATPRGEPIPLAVSEVNPRELVVRGPAGSGVEFDYMVWGLRIGFEKVSIVQPKRDESKIPSMHEHEQFLKDEPGLLRYTALERFKDVEGKVRGKSDVSLARAEALREAVGVFPYRGPEAVVTDPGRPFPEPQRRSEPTAGLAPGANPGGESSTLVLSDESGRMATSDPANPNGAATDAPGAARPPTADLDLFTVNGVVEPGDVVSLTVSAPGSVVRSTGQGDALVVGCAQVIAPDAAAAAGRSPASVQVAVATSRMALCRVDASFGAIAVGDRLTSSTSPGMAMRADPGLEGTALLGRAIDPLPTGSGLIRVLLSGR